MKEELQEIDELNSVISEIRRCLNFFQDETETTLWVEDENDNVGYIIDDSTNSKYKITIEKVN